MYPNAYDSFADSTGIIFLLIGAVGFVLSYALRKIGVKTEILEKFSMFLAAAIAALVIFSVGKISTHSGIMGMSMDLAGRTALFAIVFFSVGAILAIGSAMGAEKADKSKKN